MRIFGGHRNPSISKSSQARKRKWGRCRCAQYGIESLEPRVFLSSVTLGQTITGTITAADQVSQYTYVGQANQIARIDVADTGSGAWAPIVALVSPTETTMTAGGGGEFQSTLATSGTYLIDVHDQNLKATGEYSFSLEGISPANPSAMALGFGQVKSGSITQAAQVNEYTFI